MKKQIFSTRLTELRKEKAINQRQLAKDLAVHQSSVAYWETNKREPDLDMLVKIAEYFDVSIDYLMGITD